MQLNTLISEGNHELQREHYQAAIAKYQSALEIDASSTEAWIRKGMAHKILKEYGKALIAFSKASLLDTQYRNLRIHHESLMIKALKTEEKFPQTLDQLLRPIVCTRSYQEELQSFETVNVRGLDFTLQIQRILDLIEFLQFYFVKNPLHYPFMRPELFAQLNQELRLCEIGIPFLKAYPDGLQKDDDWLEKFDIKLLQILEDVQCDIFFEDTKKILRMLFETMYHFPREKRGEFVKHLPWDKNSWYLFDFCGAIFCSDAAIENLAKLKGTRFIPFQFHDAEKNEQQAFFLRSVMDQNLIVKIACFDLLEDLKTIQIFFDALLQRLTTKHPLDDLKMGPIPHFEALLRYSKQLFNTQRLLCILPLATNNFPMRDPSFEAMGCSSSESPLLIIHEMIDKEANSNEEKKKIHGLINQIFATVANMQEDKMDREASSAERLLYHCSPAHFNPTTLKGRLAFLRKLQLVGETFSPLSWNSKDLRKVDYIDTENLYKIRTNLIHLELNPSNFQLIIELESDKERITKMFEDLQTLRENVSEATVKRQQGFPAWPAKSKEKQGFHAWGPFAREYWQVIKSTLSGPSSDFNFIPSQDLLSTQETNAFLDVIIDERQNKLSQVLRGEIAWIEVEITDLFKPDLDKASRRKANSLYEKAHKQYRQLKHAYIRNQRALRTQKKEQRKQQLNQIMLQTYPSLNAFIQTLFSNQNHDVSSQNLFAILKDRLYRFHTLLKEQGLESRDPQSLQDELHTFLTQDMNFLLSSSYLLGQILLLLNQGLIRAHLARPDMKLDLEERLPTYVTLRNHLEHTDPIFESIDLPYYEMMSDAPKLMAIVMTELVYKYGTAILNYRIEDLSSSELEMIENEVKEPVTQMEALNSNAF
ncbi:putative uncharacterized protein [Parachlamydia acanthamoebae UV-7]|jgi:tetratricopeptide (TPR) repeat protein|uniref:Uncharacterized protein n=2 Tax=Parachlamydia acanthamoebae TaxID=83552 RepID=F8L104_PARAV|nr:tetratricopeptide repeat protein [Parachlamydia acanthamoebae]EFB42606.1 hypothetical protein pah_c004o120 [Parachlamydia acanthamoebae str. Hall's coccus]CCB86923.1 putative uncharacterized protein [Parachlamydia acanthamoebae UV-7]